MNRTAFLILILATALFSYIEFCGSEKQKCSATKTTQTIINNPLFW